MTGSALTSAPTSANCNAFYPHLTAQQWQACWNAGLRAPGKTGAHLAAAGHSAVPALIAVAVAAFLIWALFFSGRRSGRPVASK